VDKALAYKRHKEENGLTNHEVRVLALRAKDLKWIEIAKILEITRGRASHLRGQLIRKGYLDEDGMLTDTGMEKVDG